eukprot:scaffold4798_cov375-Prasinococcus_capsulatus_cf.AAC.2
MITEGAWPGSLPGLSCWSRRRRSRAIEPAGQLDRGGKQLRAPQGARTRFRRVPPAAVLTPRRQPRAPNRSDDPHCAGGLDGGYCGGAACRAAPRCVAPGDRFGCRHGGERDARAALRCSRPEPGAAADTLALLITNSAGLTGGCHRPGHPIKGAPPASFPHGLLLREASNEARHNTTCQEPLDEGCARICAASRRPMVSHTKNGSDLRERELRPLSVSIYSCSDRLRGSLVAVLLYVGVASLPPTLVAGSVHPSASCESMATSSPHGSMKIDVRSLLLDDNPSDCIRSGEASVLGPWLSYGSNTWGWDQLIVALV